MPGEALRIEGLTKHYGDTVALDDLSMVVESGQVYGLLGPNGAGKSTLIRLLLDLIRPTSGVATVLGLDPRKDKVALHRRLGYLSGDFVVDGRQTGLELLTFLGNIRGGVAPTRIAELADWLDLDPSRRIKTLSKGNRQKIGLIQAVMHEPELLVLDEPTSGLDPFLQHEFATMVREVANEGRTVFVSSHAMAEVQHIADRVGIIREGRLVAVEEVEDLRDRSMRKVSIEFAVPVRVEDFDTVPGVDEVRVDGAHMTCRLDGRADDLIKAVARHTVVTLSVEEPDLEELFFKYYERVEPK